MVQAVCANHSSFSPLSHQGLFQNLCPSVPGGRLCQRKALGNTSVERQPTRLLSPHACQCSGCFLEAIGMASWRPFAHAAALLPHTALSAGAQTKLAGSTLNPSTSLLVAPPPSLDFLAERNKLLYSGELFQGK